MQISCMYGTLRPMVSRRVLNKAWSGGCDGVTGRGKRFQGPRGCG